MKHNATVWLGLLAFPVVCAASGAMADVLYLDYIGKTGTIGDATFISIDPSWGSGTGNINPFLRVQANDVEEGFNNGGKELDTKDSDMVDLALIPISTYTGSPCYELLLDINESNGHYVAMVDLEIYAVPQASANVGLTYQQVSDNYTPVYEFDFDTDGSKIVLDYRLNPGGSGWGDLITLIPQSLFPSTSTYLYMYTKLGQVEIDPVLNEYVNSDNGFEEWAYNDTGPITPEPTTLSLVGLGGLMMLRRKKRLSSC